MAAYNTEYAVIDQSPKPAEPLYHLLVQLILYPTFESARELFFQLQSMKDNKYTPLTLQEQELLLALFLLLEVLQFDRHLDTENPLWLITLRLANALAEPALDPKPTSGPVKYVLRRSVHNPMQYVVVPTDKPLYTEQVFPNRAMAEYALFRNQPYASVYDSYFYNTNYGAGGPKYFRRIV
jgi:hypothetical protein